jgi:thiol-disulfide isomerase/thioredoxin
MPGPRSALRGVLRRIAAKVAKDGLFEQSGERPRTPPLSTFSTSSQKTDQRSNTDRPTPAVTGRPSGGCVPVDAAGLPAVLRPSGKPLVINHWASWCEPCVDELPRLVRSAAGLADKAEFLGLSWDLFDHPGKAESIAKKVADFADSYGVGYGNVLFTGKPEELFQICGLKVHQVPQTLVIAPDGRVLYHKEGMLEDDDVFPLINAARSA